MLSLFVIVSLLFNAGTTRHALSDSMVRDALNRLFDPCPRDSVCGKLSPGAHNISQSGCKILPVLSDLYDTTNSVWLRHRIIEALDYTSNCRCNEVQKTLLKKAMSDTTLALTLRASEILAGFRCPEAGELLEKQMKSVALTQRVAAVYGLELLGRDGVFGLLDGLRTPNDSITQYRDSLDHWHMWKQAGPPYVAVPKESPEEVRAWLKDAEEKEATLHGIVMMAINRITGEKMDSDTLRTSDPGLDEKTGWSN